METRDRLIEIVSVGIKTHQNVFEIADALIAASVEFCNEIIKPYEVERFGGKTGHTYSMKCGRCNKTVQSKWSYCPFCGTRFRAAEARLKERKGENDDA